MTKLIISDTALNIDSNAMGENLNYIDLSKKKIANCIGCFSCWVKTPSKCILRDDAPSIYPLVAESNQLMYVSHIKYGGYDTIMKTFLERNIPIQQAFIRLHRGETHHVQRNVVEKHAVIIAYGDISHAEQAIFTKLVKRNANNMSFLTYQIIFTSENELDQVVEKEVAKWNNC